LSNVQIADEETVLVDACDAEDIGISDLYLTDVDSSFRPPGSTAVGTSTIIGDAGSIYSFIDANTGSAASFIDTSKCTTSIYHRCSKYCEDTCLRTVTYTVDPAGTENYVLKVCEVGSGICTEIEGTYYYDVEDTDFETLMRNTRSDRFRYFSVTLPNGNYTATFLDNGVETWPSFVDETYEDALCTENVLQEGSVTLQIPTPAQCDDLIKNGDAESSPDEPLYWLHRKGGVVLNTTDPRNGLGALGDLERTDAGMDSISQYLDTRCLAE